MALREIFPDKTEAFVLSKILRVTEHSSAHLSSQNEEGRGMRFPNSRLT